MGQYYQLVNLCKKQSMSPVAGMFRGGGRVCFSKYTSGSKLAEQLHNLGVKPMLALALIAMSPDDDSPNPLWGSWAGDRVVLIGDYSDDVPHFLTEAEGIELQARGQNLYGQSYGEMAADSGAWFKAEERLQEVVPSHVRHVFVNTDKDEFIDPFVFGSHQGFADFYQEGSGVMKALYSCLFYSTGSGGGDIPAFREGRWAGNRLKVVPLSEAYSAEYKDVSHEVNRFLLAHEDE